MATIAPGGVVDYTFTITNTGQATLPGAAVTADFTDVFDDAVYNGDISATTGTLNINPTLHTATWAGDLDPGAEAIVTGSVTVKDPYTGDGILFEKVTSDTLGSTCTPGAEPGCSVTVTVIPGVLSITVPASADLGATEPGGTTGAGLGTVQVVDERDQAGLSWTATVSATSFTTGGETPAETIPAGDATYFINKLSTTTGNATFTPTPVTPLSATPQTIVTSTGAAGDTTATWNPTIQVTVPATAIVGTYTATITHSVS